MIESVIAGSLLALLTGYLPGPFTTMVASTGLHRGVRAGARLSLVTFVTDLPPMFLTAFVLTKLNSEILRIIGFLGGFIVLYLGVKVFRRAGEPLPKGPRIRDEIHDLLTVAVGGLLSPAPWLFWLVVGSPLLIRSLSRGWWEAGVFSLSFFGVLIATQISVAWLASRGGRLAGDKWRPRILRMVSVLLFVGGALVVWQSWVGNFVTLIKSQESLRSAVEERVDSLPVVKRELKGGDR